MSDNPYHILRMIEKRTFNKWVHNFCDHFTVYHLCENLGA